MRVRPQWFFRDFRVSVGLNRQWTTSGDVTWNWFRPVFLKATFRNNWSLTLNPLAIGWGNLSVTALRGGPALRENPWWNHFSGITTDRRKPVALELWTYRGGNFNSRGDWFGFEPTLYIRPKDVLNFKLSLSYSWNRNPEQWVDRATVHDSTHYILAEINQKTLSLTARLNWTITPTLTIELYGQPFVSSGAYTSFKEVVAPRTRKYQDRFRFYEDELVCDNNGLCNVDLNQNGSVDFSFRNPDFRFLQLRSTLVIRWEYRPGSVFFFAWQHGRQNFLADGSFGGFHHFSDLLSLDSDNTFLIKFNYWLSF